MSLWLTSGLSVALMHSGATHSHEAVRQSAVSALTSAPEPLSLHLDLVHPDSSDSSVIALQLTLTNATDQLLAVRTFRAGNLDDRVVLLRDSTRVHQIGEVPHDPYIPSGIGTLVKPHSNTKELINLFRLYKMEPGDYQAYVVTK